MLLHICCLSWHLICRISNSFSVKCYLILIGITPQSRIQNLSNTFGVKGQCYSWTRISIFYHLIFLFSIKNKNWHFQTFSLTGWNFPSWKLEKAFKKSMRKFNACGRYFLSSFYFLRKMITFWKLWKIFFISSKKLFLFSRYSNVCNFFHSFPHFPDPKGQVEVE